MRGLRPEAHSMKVEQRGPGEYFSAPSLGLALTFQYFPRLNCQPK